MARWSGAPSRPDSGPALEPLYEQPGLAGFGIATELAARYGGDLGFDGRRLYANFVSSIDGLVALAGSAESGQIISAGSQADRFVMGLLRACADAVLLGAGTFRKTPGHLWHAEVIYPDAAVPFAALRKKLGLRPRPRLILVTASGDVDTARPALRDAVIVTTPAGEARLRGRVPADARLVVAGPGPLRLADALALARDEGTGSVLTEGGPTLVGQLLAEGLLDELFLTVSPTLFGRFEGDGRKSLVDGVDLDGGRARLLSARRFDSHLFLRYALRPA